MYNSKNKLNIDSLIDGQFETIEDVEKALSDIKIDISFRKVLFDLMQRLTIKLNKLDTETDINKQILVSFTLKDYMTEHNESNYEKTNKQIIKCFELLKSFEITIYNENKGNNETINDYIVINLGTGYRKRDVISANNKFKRTEYTFKFSPDFCNLVRFKTAKRPFFKALNEINARKFPHAFSIGYKFMEHFVYNITHTDYNNRLSVISLLQVTDIPAENDVPKRNRKQKIMQPFLKNLNYFKDNRLIVYKFYKKVGKGRKYYTDEQVQKMSYDEFKELYIEFVPIDSDYINKAYKKKIDDYNNRNNKTTKKSNKNK